MGDFGRDKTLTIEYDRYFWTGIYKDVIRFLRHCQACQFGKGVSQNTSLYTPLPEPNAPCSLGLSEYGFHVGTPHDSILVMLDCYFKMVHFIPCSKTFDATHIANLFFKEAVRVTKLKQALNCQKSGMMAHWFNHWVIGTTIGLITALFEDMYIYIYKQRYWDSIQFKNKYASILKIEINRILFFRKVIQI